MMRFKQHRLSKATCHIRLLCLLVFLFHSSILMALIFDNQEIPKTVVLEDTGDVLTLRGAALHKNFFTDGYIGAFYSLDVVSTPAQALADAGPKRMWFFFLRSFDSPKKYWEQAIKNNNSPQVLERDQINISQFFKMVDYPLNEGDILILDYIPNVGTRVIVKGTVRGIIKGNEFYSLILKVWMGRQPPSEKFRKDLFNLS